MSDDAIKSIETFNPESRVLFDVTVEIPKGTKNKYEMDRLTGRIRLDRTLFVPTQYPYDHGFIEDTPGLDGDPPDAMAIGAELIFPGCLIQYYAVVMSRMADEMGGDDKVLCIPTTDTRRRHPKDLDSVAEYILLEIEHLFSVCKNLGPGKPVEGVTWVGRKEAEEEIIASIERTEGTSFEHHHVNLA